MFDPTEAGFLADPYPTLSALREETPVFYEETLGRWFVTRHADVRACLRDKRLGRNFRHVGSEKEFGADYFRATRCNSTICCAKPSFLTSPA
jgi:unspecific monooxygenase